MGPGQKILICIRSGKFFVARVGSVRASHLWFEFEFGKFPLKKSNFSIFYPSGQKKSLRVRSKSIQVKGGLASYLLRVKSKLGSGQGPSLPNSARNLDVTKEFVLDLPTFTYRLHPKGRGMELRGKKGKILKISFLAANC